MFLFGLILVLLGALVLASDWGELDPDAYQSWCIFAIMNGGVLFLTSIFGCCGIVYQTEREGFWTGRKILGLFQFILLIIFAFSLDFTVDMTDTVSSLQKAEDSISSSSPLTYDQFEKKAASSYNSFYFAGITNCGFLFFLFICFIFISFFHPFLPKSLYVGTSTTGFGTG